MLLDAREVPTGTTVTCDVCVVGAGPAGLTLAKDLACFTQRIVVLSSGGLSEDRWSESLNHGSVSGLPHYPLKSTQSRALRGTARRWGGGWVQSARLSPLDFRERSWVPFSGWPISYESLAQYYERAESTMGLGSEPYDGAYWGDKLGYSLLPVNPSVFSTLVFRNSSTRFVNDALDAAIRSDQISLYSHANVVELRSHRSGEVAAARVQTRDGGIFDVEADIYVLACGAVQNARLLLASGNAKSNGLGNEADVVGRYFMEHPNLDFGDVQWETSLARSPLWASPFHLKDVPMKPVLALTAEYQETHGLLNFTLYFRPLLTYLRKLARWAGIGAPTPTRSCLHFRFEVAPSPDCRITLGANRDRLGMRKPHVHAKMGAFERRTLQHFCGALAKELVDRKLGRIDVGSFLDRPWENGMTYQHHLLGGTRMHPDPRHGVVDLNCRVHTVSNLYVSGSSVFPSGGNANPTLTIVAMAHRLADHLAAIGQAPRIRSSAALSAH